MFIKKDLPNYHCVPVIKKTPVRRKRELNQDKSIKTRSFSRVVSYFLVVVFVLLLRSLLCKMESFT